jgi:putative tryptophan/tyrosine transport system substrate-binding protein
VRRRAFVAALGGAAAWPLVTSAQETGRTYRIGFLTPFGRETPTVGLFLDELRLNGFIEGQNLTVVPGGMNVRTEQIAQAVAALVNAAPDVIFTGPDIYTRAIQGATRTIPIIALSGSFVEAGLVTSLARPGGNITGVSIFAPELDGKGQGILMEVAPNAHRMAAIADSTMARSTPTYFQALKDAVRSRNVEFSIFTVAKPEEVGPAIDAAKASGAEALNFLATPMFFTYRKVIIEHVAVVRLPAMYQSPEMAEDGGLVAYGSRTSQFFRQVARLVVKVLRGAKPADLPVEQPTNFELVINLKTAKSIGYEVPAGLVLRADKLIE